MVLQLRVLPNVSCNIGVKPGDPSTDALFAFVFFCFHSRLKERLKAEGLLEDIPTSGCSILPNEE